MEKPLDPDPAQRARVILPCDADRLDATIDFFRERLGFRMLAIQPADSPTVAILSGGGTTVELNAGHEGGAGAIRLLGKRPTSPNEPLVAPNGTAIFLDQADPPLVIPELQARWGITRRAESPWGVGRAGLRYRDLIPDRQGGRFIASHIQVPDGGPVPDYVHYHRIRFQMIYVYKGWVRLVYEDQGPPFVMQAGDCVLQPPQIRHRVLECSDGFEVIELGCPAEHETLVEHGFDLPTPAIRPDRNFGGQRYVLHRVEEARWTPWWGAGFECRDTGIGHATEGLAGARVARSVGASAKPTSLPSARSAELHFLFLLSGSCGIDIENDRTHGLEVGDSVVLPLDRKSTLVEPSTDLELLEVTLPARPQSH